MTIVETLYVAFVRLHLLNNVLREKQIIYVYKLRLEKALKKLLDTRQCMLSLGLACLLHA